MVSLHCLLPIMLLPVGCLQTHSLLFTFSSSCFDASFCQSIALALITSDSVDAHIQGITQVALCQALRPSDSIAAPLSGVSASFLGTASFSFSMLRLFCLDSGLDLLHFCFVLSLSSLTDAHTTGLYLLMNNLPCPVPAQSPPQSSSGELDSSICMSHRLLTSVLVSFLLLQRNTRSLTLYLSSLQFWRLRLPITWSQLCPGLPCCIT